MWLSSADWMNRNMMRRVEIAWPILDEKNRARILNECCEMYLKDNKDAWLMNADGSYSLISNSSLPAGTQNTPEVELFSAQQQLLKKYTD